MTESIDRTNAQLATVLADLAEVVAAVGDDQLRRPTPCAEFDVGELRRHILGWLTTFAAGYADPQGQAPAGIDDYQTPADPAAEARAAADRLTTAIGAGAAERPLSLGESAMPGELALGMILWEYQMHGWDLARAIGQPWSPPEAAAEESLAFAPMMLTDDYQGEGKMFGPRVEVPEDAPAFDRLLGLSGRDPAWAPR